MNALYLRRRSKVILPEGAGATPLNVIATAQKNFEALGFLLAEDVVEGLKRLSPIQVNAFYQRLVNDLRSMVGAHRPFKPMYPNFPAQVMEMTEAELYFNAILYYWTLKLPETEAGEREPTRRQAEAPAHPPRHPRGFRGHLHLPGPVEVAVLAAGSGGREVVRRAVP